MLSSGDINFMSEILTFWDKLCEQDHQTLIENTVSCQFNKGEKVHSLDSDCIGVLLIKSGGVRVYILSEDGREITLYRLFELDVCPLSASCLFENITFDVHIVAETSSEILLINSNIYGTITDHNVYAMNYTYKIVIDRFSSVMWAMEQILFMSFDKRLAIFLLDESSKIKSDELLLTHEEISKYLGSAREVVSRMLKYFSSEGIVELSRGSVKILNKQKLRALL